MPKDNIEGLIEALTIFKKYLDPDSYSYVSPTHCEHDVLYVGVDPAVVSEEDKNRLRDCTFEPRHFPYYGHTFCSYHFGSA